MEHITERIARLEALRYDWERKSWEAAVVISPFTTDREHQAYWDIRRAFARVTIELRVQQADKGTIASTLIERIKHEIAETNWGLVLVLAEEFLELNGKPDENTKFVRRAVERIHADICRPRFAGWMPSFQKYRAWHLAVSERLLARLSEA